MPGRKGAGGKGRKGENTLQQSQFSLSPFLPFSLSIPILITLALALYPAALPAQNITNPGTRIIIAPGAQVQFQGGGINQPVTPAASVINAPFDTNAPVFAFAAFDPPVIHRGNRGTYRLIVSCSDGDVRPPARIASGPRMTPGARSQQLIVVDGKVRRIWTFNYHVEPERIGTMVIPSYSFQVNGQKVDVPSTSLRIVMPEDPTVPPPLQLVLTGPDRPVYVGETVAVGITLGGLSSGPILGMTALDVGSDGLLVDRNSMYTRQRKTVTNVGGRAVTTIETAVLVTPLREGPLLLTGQTEVALEGPTSFSSVVPGYRPLVESVPIIIYATNVPAAGRLPGYNGAIGQFELNSALATNSVRVGDPMTLTLTLRGEGNLPTIPSPLPAADEAWQVLPPKADSAQPLADNSGMTRTFHYVLIPVKEGTRSTPAIPFSYFNPATSRYVDLSLAPKPVTILPGPTNAAAAAAPAPAAAKAASQPASGKPEERDELRPLMSGPGRTVRRLKPLQSEDWFLLLQLVPATVLGGLWLWDRRRRFLAAHPEVLAFRQARQAAREHLEAANAQVMAGNGRDFANEAIAAMRALCAPRVKAHPESLVASDLLACLPPDRRAGTDGEMIRSFFAVVDSHRFSASAANATGLLKRREEVVKLVDFFEQELRSYVEHCVRHGSESAPRPSVEPGTLEAAGNRAVAVIVLFAAVIVIAATAGSPSTETFQQGVAACLEGNHTRAASAFRDMAEREPSAGAYHNLGNAEWLRGRTGEAILAWERASWIDPLNEETRANLRLARRTGHLLTPTLTWFEACSSWLPANFWAWAAMGSFWLAGALLILPSALRWARAGWHQPAAALALTLFLLTLPALAGVQARSHRGIVMDDNTPIRLTPTAAGEILTRLPLGDSAKASRTEGQFFYLRTANGASGWVGTNSFRLIAP